MPETVDADTGGLESRFTDELRFIITGVDGFVGRCIAAKLIKLGYSVCGLVESKNQLVPLPDGLDIVVGDILKPSSFESLFSKEPGKKKVVIHTAAIISARKHNRLCERVNVIGTKNILDACKKNDVGRFIYFSSVDALECDINSTVLTEPLTFSADKLPTSYGKSKAVASKMVLDSDCESMRCVVLLPTAITGPGDYRIGLVTKSLIAYLSGPTRFAVKGGYDWVDVRDVADAAIKVSLLESPGKSYILSNKYFPSADLLGLLAARAGRKKPKVLLPRRLLYLISIPVSLICLLSGSEPPITIEAVRLMRLHPVFSHEKAFLDFGFYPRPIEETMADTADFILAGRKTKHY